MVLCNILARGTGVVLAGDAPPSGVCPLAHQGQGVQQTRIVFTPGITLGALLARVQPHRRLKIYRLSVAVLLTVLEGCSRVYLGVHWPTDVLAGWAAGVAWALGIWSAPVAASPCRRVPVSRPCCGRPII